MSALIKLHHEIVSRRNLAVLQAVMESRRASLLQKQEAELTLLRTQLAQTELERDRAWAREGSQTERVDLLRDMVTNAMMNQQRLTQNRDYIRAELYKAYEENHELEADLDKQAFDAGEEIDLRDHLLEQLAEVKGNYSALIVDCLGVGDETKENARGHKRKLPATEQLKKINAIVLEHKDKHAKKCAGDDEDQLWADQHPEPGARGPVRYYDL